MAVSIRLRRGGKKKQPFYRIVAADSRCPKEGRFLEILGYYNPIPENEEVEVKAERLIYWLKVGAQPSATVKSLLKRKGIWKNIVAGMAGEPFVVEPAIEIEEIALKELPIEDIPVEELSVEDTSVEETPVEDIPVEETPVEDIPGEETPVEDVPVEKPPVEDSQIEEVPIEEVIESVSEES